MAAEEDLQPGEGAAIVPPPGAPPAELAPGAGAEITPPSSTLRRVGDAGISLAKGVIGLPEAAVGIADLTTGGHAGKFLENEDGAFGFRPKEAKAYLDTFKSPEQQAADQAVSEADGFIPTVGAMLQHPSTIVGTAAESAPSMLAGGAVARGFLGASSLLGKAIPAIGRFAGSEAAPIVAGAVGEGVTAAGQNAEQVRQETPGGLLPDGASPILAASGALTAGISFGAGKFANKLGLGDVNTMLAQGKMGVAVPKTPAEKVLAEAAAKKGIWRKAGEGFLVEGGLQETPQSAQEQAAQNIAEGKPLLDGVGAAAAQGLFVGGLTGAVAGPLEGDHHQPAKPPAPPPGPFTAALGLPAPPKGSITVGPDGTAMTPGQQLDEQNRTTHNPLNGTITENGGPGAGGYPVIDAPATQVADNPAAPMAQPLQPGVAANPRSIAYNAADPEDQKAYDHAFGTQDVQDVTPHAPRTALDAELDKDIPWNDGEGHEVDDLTLLQQMGYTPEEAQDAIKEAYAKSAATKAAPEPGSDSSSTGEAEQHAAGATGERAGNQEGGPSAASTGEAPAGQVAPEPAPVPAVKPQAEAEPKGAKSAGGNGKAPTVPAPPALVEHVTGKGKKLMGVIRKDMTIDEAKTIDPYAFKKGGGVFIREAHLAKLAARDADVKGSHGADVLDAGQPVADAGAKNNAGGTGAGQATTREPLGPVAGPAASTGANVNNADTGGGKGANGRDGKPVGPATEPGGRSLLGGKDRAPVDDGGRQPDGSDGTGAVGQTGKPNSAPDANAGGSSGGAGVDTVPPGLYRPQQVITHDGQEWFVASVADGGKTLTLTSKGGKKGVAPTYRTVTVAKQGAAPAPAVPAKANTVFTADAAAKARETLKAFLAGKSGGEKLSIADGTTAAPLPPEVLMAGITLSGFHIEAGARSFADYTRAMVADLGAGIKPYLKSFYLAAKFDPRAAAFEGMDAAGDVEKANVNAAPKAPLYSQMKVAPNTVEALTKWAAEQGLPSVVKDMHVTVGFSRDPVDASGVPLGKPMALAPGGKTSVEKLGKDGAIVLMLPENPGLTARHQALRDAGASWDFPSYQPHITITYNGEGVDLSKVKPYRGFISLLGEERSELELDNKAPAEAPAPAPAPAAKKELVDHFYEQIKGGNMPSNNLQLKRMVEEFEGKPADPARMKNAQEDLEAAIAMTTRDTIAATKGERQTFDKLVEDYGKQPLLNIRTSTSVANQAYSTPAPLAYLASELAGVTKSSKVLEPTAGTGMLLVETDPRLVVANEINPHRQGLLLDQGYNVTRQDATTAKLAPANSQDVVITNPPFGPVKDAKDVTSKVKIDGYTIGQIDHQIVMNALTSMKDDGRAVLIIGANKVAGGVSTDDRIFFNWLYSHYNVTSHFEVDGGLYARQGAAWPVRVITINGRQESTKVSPAPGVIQRALTWDQVYEQFANGMAANRQPDTGAGASPVGAGSQAGQPGRLPGGVGGKGAGVGGRGPGGGAPGAGNVVGTRTQPDGNSAGGGTVPMGDANSTERLGAEPVQPDTVGATGNPATLANREPKPAGDAGATSLVSEENQFQATYVAQSGRKDKNVLIPVNMAQPLHEALARLEDEVGDIDEYVAKELGYASVDDLVGTDEKPGALMGLQVDSVGMAIHQFDKNDSRAIIIADQTGIGKGRQAAAMIRWAERRGMVPVFISVKPELFTDMYGDLHDIGTDNINPFIMNREEAIAGPGHSPESPNWLFANGNKHTANLRAIVADGKLPAGSNAMFMTYSQINTDNLQRNALSALAPNAFFVMDEAHNAAGDASQTGEYLREVLALTKGVTYLSATYAKRPDNMPLYFKTDIGDIGADGNALMEAMKAGGLPLQTVVSNNLVQAGQMFRRERSFDGITFETKVDTVKRAEHERMSDVATESLRAIVKADKLFHSIYIKSLQADVKAAGQQVVAMGGNKPSTTVAHSEFSSVVHNFVKQMLLSLKAQTAADEAIADIKRGVKPVIALENTMESFLTDYVALKGLKVGDSLGAYDYRTVLSRALERSRVYTFVDDRGNKSKVKVKLDDLDPMTRAAYDDAQRTIDAMRLNIPVSPIDWIRSQVTKAGHTIAEVTGRTLTVDYTDPKRPVLGVMSKQEQEDKVTTTRQFNAGATDSLILNVSGSTGISLHSSENFADQRPRRMVVAQAAADINTFMQMLGRVHRTGQVVLPQYAVLNVDLPTEKRPTAVLARKMKSLNANTSSNTDSATSVKSQDMLNKYGDEVINTFLQENPTLARAIGVTPTSETPEYDFARKVTGRLALQPIKVQQDFYDEVESTYAEMIDYLNKTNTNDLEPRTADFDAQELRTEVMYHGENPESPFGQDAIYGEYSIKAQGKAMTPAEIKATMAENLDGQTPDSHQAAMQTQLNDQFKTYYEGLEGEARSMADIGANRGRAFLNTYPIGEKVRIDINGDSYNAIVTNIRNTHKKAGNPFAMSKFRVTVAVNGSLRSVTFPGTLFDKAVVSHINPGYAVDQLFKEQPANQRELAKIVSGNLLAAYGEMTGAGNRGSIINFTKQDGTVGQGILLPKSFDFKENTRGDYRLKSGDDALKFLNQSQSKDVDKIGIQDRTGDVRVVANGRGVEIRVPKSKARGGKYFLDKNLIAVAGDFVTRGDKMVATVRDRADAVKALDILQKKTAIYTVPSMSDEARAMLDGAPKLSIADTPAIHGAAFESWFAGSKVVDEDGQPLVVYHGTGNDITQFQTEQYGSPGFFFADNPSIAGQYADDRGALAWVIKSPTIGVVQRFESKEEAQRYKRNEGPKNGRIINDRTGPNIVPAYLSIKNPLEIDAKGAQWARIKAPAEWIADQVKERVEGELAMEQRYSATPLTTRQINKIKNGAADFVRANMVFNTDSILYKAKALGHDGVIIKNVIDQITGTPTPMTVYATFTSEQIKSATGNQGTYDATNPDIRLSDSLRAAQTTESATNIDTVPASAGRQEKADKAGASLRKNMSAGTTFEAVEPGDGVDAATKQMLAATRTMASRLFGHDVVFVKFPEGTAPLFNGMVSKATPGTIYVRVDSAKPHMAIAGHELLHQLRETQPGLYRALASRLEALYKDKAAAGYYDEIKQKYEDAGLRVPTDWDEEMIADVVGDHFMDPKFWSDLAAKGEPGQFRLIANAIIKFLQRLRNLMTGEKPFGTEQMLTDLDAAREAVVAAMRRFSADQLANPGPRVENRYARWTQGEAQDRIDAMRQAGVPVPPELHDAARDPASEMLSIIGNPKAMQAAAREATAEFFNTPGKIGWWHKTVGSPYNLAQRNPLFKRVFDNVQDFLKDVSKYATEAADLAPNILPKLETLADIKNKAPVSAADSKAIARPIFEGTLTWARDERNQPIQMAKLEAQYEGMSEKDKAGVMLRKGFVAENELKRWQALPIDSYNGAVNNRFEQTVLKAGVVWKDSELKSMFGLNDQQIGLYKEFRAAIDKSLENLGLADMVRFAGKDGEAIKQMVLDSGDAQIGAELLREHLTDMAHVDPQRSNVLMDTANRIIDKADRVKDLQDRGYAPLSRFGQHTVDVVDKDGERAYFGMFESPFEAAKKAKEMAANFPGATIQRGTVSQEAHKLFAGVTPETLELFGNMLGLESSEGGAQHEAFQQYLKLAKSNRSAMKRLIQRKGIAGFSEDPGRVLAGFVYSNARQTANNVHAGDIKQAVADIPQQQGQVKDEAARLAQYVQNPTEEAAKFRGLLFAQYIGGSVASAMVNLTQPLQTTFPYLSQFGGIKQAAVMTKNAARDALRPDEALKAKEPDLYKALKRAEEEGTVSPQETHQLLAQSRGEATLKSGDGTRLGDWRAKGENAMSRLQFAWGKLFSTAEQFNRRLTFIASYRTAVANGMSYGKAFDFAEKAIAETQFVANKGNRPDWARGAVGSTLFTFKQYSVSYLEMVSRMAQNGPEGRKAAALALGVLFLMAGAGGLPFADDLSDLIDGIMQRLGYASNIKASRQALLQDVFGEAGGQFVEKGISGVSGFPLDISGRMGMSNLIPGTGLLTKKADHTKDVAELFGPAGDFATRAFQSAGQLVDGHPVDAAFSMAPKAITNLRQGLDMATTGAYHDAKGRKVIDVNGAEALSKAIGFQPQSVAKVQNATGNIQDLVEQNRMASGQITDTWAQGIAQKDPSLVKEAQDAMRAWNAKNPDSPIRPNLAAIVRRAKMMDTDKVTRIEKSAPKLMKAQVREQLGAVGG